MMSVTGTTTLSRLPLLLWQMPELENCSPPVCSAELGAEAIDGIDDAFSSLENQSDEPSTVISEQDHVARGYAEGWERGLTEGREAGYTEGREMGYAEGIAAAQTALAGETRRLTALVAQLSAPVAALDATVEEAIAALALEVARCVIGSETSQSRAYLVALIREAVAKVPIELGRLQIVVNPADRDLILGLAPEIADGNATLVADDGVEPGDCVVVANGQGATVKDLRWRPRTGEGVAEVDLSLATRWRNVMRAMFEGEQN